ncbi:hypothetical protein B0H16DRAFT_1735762 [Mycena metata]|uniref:Uncharacterized protein n=1 Tax=Mycena metata TaxID=1033252 RepID=A0AAD7HQU3_9AGAR|nr:hypothetical protein B0H16DRAFT_1735762 [Mycena metata]
MNANDTDDADLARAIAESLRDIAPAAASNSNSPFLQPNERQIEGEEGRAGSGGDQQSTAANTNTTNANAPTAPSAGMPTAGGGAPSFLTDRAQMERERLVRQKRVRPPLPVVARPASSDDEYDEDEEEGSEGSARARLDARGAASGGGGAGGGNGQAGGRTGASGSASGNTLDGRRLVPQGAILRVDTQHARVHSVPLAGSSASTSASTNTLGGSSMKGNGNGKNNGEKPQAPAIPECIRLSALLGPPASIAFAIVSAYVLDAAWLYGFFDRATPVVVVAHGEGDRWVSG